MHLLALLGLRSLFPTWLNSITNGMGYSPEAACGVQSDFRHKTNTSSDEEMARYYISGFR